MNNNGLTDSSLATLLDGLTHMQTISVIDLRKNCVGEQSVNQMSYFMGRRVPMQLQVLKIVDCKMSHPTTFKLLELIREHSNLRTLALVHASFDEKNEE